VHGLPLVGVNHLEGHIYAAFLTDDPPEYPFLALVVSGGHTALYHARARATMRCWPDARRRRGRGLRQGRQAPRPRLPGGPIVQRTAESGDPAAIAFPASRMTDGARDFSFSGIKTSVSLYVKRHGPLSERQIADVAASFQAAVVRMLVRKTIHACEQTGVRRVVLTGGVAATGRCARRSPRRPPRTGCICTSRRPGSAPTTPR